MPLAPGAERVLAGNSSLNSVRARPQGSIELLEIISEGGSRRKRPSQFQDGIPPGQRTGFRTQNLQLCGQISYSLIIRSVVLAVGVDIRRLPASENFLPSPNRRRVIRIFLPSL